MVVLDSYIVINPTKIRITDKSDYVKDSKKCVVFLDREDYTSGAKILGGYRGYVIKNYILVKHKNKWYRIRKCYAYKIGVVVRS